MTRYWIFAALAVLLLPLRSDAQALRAWGAKAGLTTANQVYSYKQFAINLSPDRRIGFSVALYADWLDGAPLSISTELGYTQRGMKETFNVTGPDGPDVIGTILITNRLDYLSLPVLATVHVEAPSVSPFVEFGPRLDILLGYSSDMGAFDVVYDEFRRVTVGATLGIGLTQRTLFSHPVRIEARYNWDLTKSYSTEFLDVSNNAVDILLGVEF